jgi:phosphomannomutase
LQYRGAGEFLKSTELGIGKFLCQARRVAQIKFGTDGWRAVIAEDFNFASLPRVVQAKADLKV